MAVFPLSTATRALARRALLAFALTMAVTPSGAQEQLEPLTIVTKGGARHVFSVEVARDESQRARGLMFRRVMPENRGMLFDFDGEQEVTMWMKNTYISLDMLFVRRDGTIHRIAAGTEPLSEKTISSNGPVYAVLEINAGVSAKLGIARGDRIEHPMFKP